MVRSSPRPPAAYDAPGLVTAPLTHRVLCLVAALALTAGCGARGDQADPPRRASECNDMPYLEADPGYVLGFDWHQGTHAYEDTVVIGVCAGDNAPSTVTLEPLPAGVSATPSMVRLTGTGREGLIPVRISVAAGATGTLVVEQSVGGDLSGSSASASGPKIVSGADGWHFEPSH